MLRMIPVAMIVFGLAVLFLTLTKGSKNQLEVKTYFRDARGLRPGAPVRVAGVEVGRVADVRVRPELKEHPAEVVLRFQAPYELEIPSDSVVWLGRDGLLCEIYAEVDVRHSSGTPVGNQVWKARGETVRPSGESQEEPVAAAPPKDASRQSN